MTSTRPAAAPPPAADHVAALEEERDFLLGSLRDLDREREAGDIDEDDYRTLHDDYTARAAAALRALEAARRPPAAPGRRAAPGSGRGRGTEAVPGDGPAAAPGLRPGPRPGRSRRVVATVAVMLVVAVLAGIGVAAFSGERLSGQSSAGGSGTTSETARHTAKAQQLEGQNKVTDALKEYDAAIKADPRNVVALTYKGWLLARAGLTDPAMASLDAALAADPSYPDAHFFRGMVLYEAKNDPAGAVTEFQTYLASNPPASAASAVQGVLDKARQAAASPPAPPPAGPAPPGG
ncbi:MAG: tetratricopeptide repeat protein [Acidimicrobiales bacterium]